MQIHQPSVTGSLAVTGSIIVTGSTTISGSLFNPTIAENNSSDLITVKVDTSSGAFFFSTGSAISITGSDVIGPFGPNSIISASYAVSSSHEIVKEVSSSHADQADTASFVTGSNVYGIVSSASFAISASHSPSSLSASYATTASFALSASYAPSDTDWYEGPTYLTASKDVYITGSTVISSSLTVSGSTFLTGSFISTGSNIFAHHLTVAGGAGTWSTQTGLPTVDSSCVSAAGSYTTGIMAGGCVFNNTPGTSQPSCTCVNTFNGVTWSSITNLNCGRFVHGTTGDSSAALVFGGRYNNCFTGTYCTTLSTEEWNGLAWSYGGNMNQCRNAFGSVGTATDAFAIAGYGNTFPTNPLPTENYNAGTNTWSACPPITTGRSLTTATGNSNSATLFAGYSTNTVETWNGVSWGSGPNYPAATYGLTGVGSAQDALIMGGGPSASPTYRKVYSYDGNSFTAQANSPYSHNQEASFGDQTCAVVVESSAIGVYSSPTTTSVRPTLHSYPNTNCLDIFVPTTISGSLTNSTIESTNDQSYGAVVADASGTFYKADPIYDLDRLTTASVSSNTITFTKGDSTTFDITVDTGSGGGGSDTDWYDGGTYLSSSKSISVTGSISAKITNNTFALTAGCSLQNTGTFGTVIGCSNTNRSPSGFVAGQQNATYNTTSNNFILSKGSINCATSIFTSILGGCSHVVNGGACTTIAGGRDNEVDNVGFNSISVQNGFIGAGHDNVLTNVSNGVNFASSIVGGRCNQNSGSYSIIGGGSANRITCTGGFGGILGGCNNYQNHCHSFIIGSNLTSTLDCTTYVNNLSISGSLMDSDGLPGTNGQVLSSNGAGRIKWTTGGGGGSDDDWYNGGTFITSSRDVIITGSLDTVGGVNFETLQVVLPLISASGHYADDSSAAAGGVPIGGLYRNGNFIAIRLT